MIGQSVLSTLITSLSRLEIFDSVNSSFQHELMENIIQPILMPRTPGQSRDVSLGSHGILVGEPLASSISQVLDRLILVFTYIHEKLPNSMSQSLADSIVPKFSSNFSESWLTPTIPLNLEGIRDFENVLVRVSDFCNTIETFGWHGQEELISWVNHFPRLWLARRRVDSLDQVRRILVQSKGTTKAAQRVEKEVVTNKDDVLLDTGVADDWDANWGNESEEENSAQDAISKLSKGDDKRDDEDDADAWGLGDEADHTTKAAEDENDDDAWGWGDDVDEEHNSEVPEPSKANEPTGRNQPDEERPSAKEITLTEHYTITDIPDSIIALIQRQITDSESLTSPE